MSTAVPARRALYNPEFLREITFVQVRLEFQALDDVLLPPFPGSALRGVLGHALRDALCDSPVRCEAGCLEPATCRYYRLCERDRDSEGGNMPKSMILDPPVPEELAAIAAGGPVREPYRVTSVHGGNPPRLTNEYGNLIQSGATFSTGLTMLGQAAALLPMVIEVLSLATMQIGRGRLVLHKVTDTGLGGRQLWSWGEIDIQDAVRQSLAPLLDPRQSVGHVAIQFITPMRLKTKEGYCFSANSLAKHFWDSALVRAMHVRDAFCAGSRERLPWMDVPTVWRVTNLLMFHYELPRLSNRQKAFMNFDGLVGRADYEGDLTSLAPLAYAAEILHVGQKATFGLGRIRCVVQSQFG